MNAPANERPSAGALLRAAREKQGLHIAALAASIKVAPRKLDALENDRWDELPDATFTRALAQTVCRSLKIDAKPVLELLPSAGAATLEPAGGGLNMPFEGRPGSETPGRAFAAIRPMMWAAAALMLAAVAVYFLPQDLLQRVSSPGSPAAETVVVTPAPVVLGNPSAASEPGGADAADAAASAPPMAGTAAPAPGTAVLPAPEAAASEPAGETVFAAPSTPSPGEPQTARLLQLVTSEVSWVEVRDGRDRVLLSRTVQPGETVGLDGATPLRLVVGNASATELSFRGQPVDLAPRTRDNVARVELQ